MLDSSKLKELLDDNFKVDEIDRMFSKMVENTVGKGEIACNEQFLLFPQCFHKPCSADKKKQELVWESFLGFLACQKHNFVILSRNDLKHGVHICCNIRE